MQIARRPADEFAILHGAEENWQPAQQAQKERQHLLGDLVGKQAGGAGHHDVGGDDLGDQAMIQTCGGRLNPR